MICIEIWLHGKPSWALPVYSKNRMSHLTIRNYADSLREHLYNVARIVQKLQKCGWELSEGSESLYSLEYVKEGVDKGGVYDELKKAGIASYEVAIKEIVEDG